MWKWVVKTRKGARLTIVDLDLLSFCGSGELIFETLVPSQPLLEWVNVFLDLSQLVRSSNPFRVVLCARCDVSLVPRLLSSVLSFFTVDAWHEEFVLYLSNSIVGGERLVDELDLFLTNFVEDSVKVRRVCVANNAFVEKDSGEEVLIAQNAWCRRSQAEHFADRDIFCSIHCYCDIECSVRQCSGW